MQSVHRLPQFLFLLFLWPLLFTCRTQAYTVAEWNPGGDFVGQTTSRILTWGQTFTPTASGTLESITIYAQRWDNLPEFPSPPTVTITLYRVLDASTVSDPLASASASTAAVPQLPDSGPLTVFFTGQDISLVEGQQYAFSATYDTSNDQLISYMSFGSGYPGGTMVTFVGSSYFPHATGFNLAFVVTASSGAEAPTPVGLDVIVTPPPVDENGEAAANAPTVVLTFDEVTGAGISTVTVLDDGPSPPAGFRLAEPAVYLEISTTATFSGFLEIAVDYSSLTFSGDAADLILAHFVDGAWLDITTSNDAANEIIYGVTDSFSPFAIFRPATPLEQLADLEHAVAALNASTGRIRSLEALLRLARKMLSDRHPKNDSLAIIPLKLFARRVQSQRGTKISAAEADELIVRAHLLIGILLDEIQCRRH